VGSELGVPDEKLLAIPDYADSPFFDDRERTALEYADAMTITGREVADELFERVRRHFSEDAIVELTGVIAWENASAKFNRALRVPSQQLWGPSH
jgi:alkylhydroperoxidase family enzyme